MTMNMNKCQFKTTEWVYLGHKVTANGVEPEEKISIMGLPVREDRKLLNDCWFSEVCG